jgi:hypothetical protein
MKKLSEIRERNQTLMTRTINDTIAENEKFAKEVIESLERHFNNDFGDLVQEDIEANMRGIESDLTEDRVLSKYKTCEGNIYIITELYQAEGFDIVTNILFCNEY